MKVRAEWDLPAVDRVVARLGDAWAQAMRGRGVEATVLAVYRDAPRKYMGDMAVSVRMQYRQPDVVANLGTELSRTVAEELFQFTRDVVPIVVDQFSNEMATLSKVED